MEVDYECTDWAALEAFIRSFLSAREANKSASGGKKRPAS
jgi:hypothetical protein